MIICLIIILAIWCGPQRHLRPGALDVPEARALGVAACADVIATGLEQAFALANLQGVPADAQGNARLRRTEPRPLGQSSRHVLRGISWTDSQPRAEL